MMSLVVTDVAGLGVLSLGFIIVFLLSIFLTALCSDCSKRSFELRDPDVEKNPSTLIRVVKLEEAVVARENPMIHEILNDEKELNPEDNSAWFTPWRSHLGAPQSQDEQTNDSAAAAAVQTESASSDSDVNHEEENSVWFTPWRSHLEAPKSHDLNGVNQNEVPPLRNTYQFSTDSAHIYQSVEDRQSSDVIVSPTVQDDESTLTNSKPAQKKEEEQNRSGPDLSDTDSSPLYARVSKKVRSPSPPPFPSSSEEEEGVLPSLPYRNMELE